MSANGLMVYDNNGAREIAIHQQGGPGMLLQSEVMELYDAIVHDKPMLHDGRWGMATAEVQWAILESGKRREEIRLERQVPVPAGY